MPTLNPAMPMDRPISDFLQPKGVTIRMDWTIDKALHFLRTTTFDTQVLYFYVLNAEDQLVGIMPARKLLLAQPTATVESQMDRGVIALRNADTLFDACELFAMHRLLAIPIIDAHRKYLGTIDVSVYTDEVFDIAHREASNELFQLIGVHLEQAKNATPFAGYKLRMPWLFANIAGGLACAMLATLFEHTLDQILLLALFIPIMLSLSESIAIQAMTLSLQTIIASPKLTRGLPREFLTALLLGLSSGLIVGLLSIFWKSSPLTPLVIGGAIGCNMLLSALIGNLVPKIINRFHLNPSVASGPIVLAAADTLSVTVYLSAATLVLIQ